MVLPRGIKPMLARNGGKPFDGAGYGFEVKWDGMRCLIVAEAATRLQNRHLRNVTGQFPELDFPALPPGTVIDGEIVVLKAGVPSFYALQRRCQLQSTSKIGLAAQTTPATFMAFDLLYLQGRKIAALPLSERRVMLEELLGSKVQERLTLTDQIVERGKAYHEAAAARGLEGVIAKRLDSPYLEGKRSSAWLKIVAWRIKPLTVLGYVKDHGAEKVKYIAVGRRKGKGWQYLGKLGALEPADQRRLYAAMTAAERLMPVPENGPSNIDWRAVDLRCYVRYFEETTSGRLRQASFKGWVARQTL